MMTRLLVAGLPSRPSTEAGTIVGTTAAPTVVNAVLRNRRRDRPTLDKGELGILMGSLLKLNVYGVTVHSRSDDGLKLQRSTWGGPADAGTVRQHRGLRLRIDRLDLQAAGQADVQG